MLTRNRKLAVALAGLLFLAAYLLSLSGGGGKQLGLLPNIKETKCELPDIRVWAQFRTHVLIPHETVSTLIDGEPRGQGITHQGNDYYWRGRPFLRVIRHTHPGNVRVEVIALRTVWLQEPGLSVKIAGGGTWQGFGPRWSTDAYDLHQGDAYRSTVHFSRAPRGPRYVQTIKYREGGKCLTLYSDGAFDKLLIRQGRGGSPPWSGAVVMGGTTPVSGVFDNRAEVLRRWELAGGRWADGLAQMYFLGWTGGPGAIVNSEGRTPFPGSQAGSEFSRLYNPRSWRELREGERITETIWAVAG